MSVDEARWVARLRARDEAAFNELVRSYQVQVFRIVLRIVGSREEAEDLAQEVFITVFKSIESFREDAKFSTWLFRIATNHARNRLKYLARRGRGVSRPYEEDPPEGRAVAARAGGGLERPDELTSARQTQVHLERALADLEPEHRELIVLRDLELMSYEEIQAVTGLAAGTVKSRLHRARQALFQLVSEREGVSPK